jgi:hypothetical protein
MEATLKLKDIEKQFGKTNSFSQEDDKDLKGGDSIFYTFKFPDFTICVSEFERGDQFLATVIHDRKLTTGFYGTDKESLLNSLTHHLKHHLI